MPENTFKLPSNIQKLLGNNFCLKKVPGDNSCFYHSVLYLVSDKYRSLSCNRDKAKMCKDFRMMLSNKLTKRVYRPFNGFISYNDMKKNLLDYNTWAGNIEWRFVCDQLKINIFMFRSDKDDIYRGWGFDNFNPNYYTVCIMNHRSVHYDPIVFCKGDSIKTKIDIGSAIAKKILKFYAKGLKAKR